MPTGKSIKTKYGATDQEMGHVLWTVHHKISDWPQSHTPTREEP